MRLIFLNSHKLWYCNNSTRHFLLGNATLLAEEGGSEGTKALTEAISNAETDVLTFDSNTAESALSIVKSNFQSVQDDLEKYKSQFNSLDWESPAAENFNARFESLSTKLRESFSNLCMSFDKAMTQAREDMEKADSANNIN